MSKLTFYIILFLGMNEIQSQTDIYKENFWHLDTIINKTENEFCIYNDFQFEIFKVHFSSDSILDQEVIRRNLEYTTGKQICADTFSYKITSNDSLILENHQQKIIYIPFVYDSSLNIRKISFAFTYGDYRNHPQWLIIDEMGRVSNYNYINYYEIEDLLYKITNRSEVNKEINDSTLEIFYNLNSNQTDSIFNLVKHIPLRKINKPIFSLSNCDETNFHLRVFHEDGIFEYDSYFELKYLDRLKQYLKPIGKKIKLSQAYRNKK